MAKLKLLDIFNQLERGHNHPHPQGRERHAQQDQLPPHQPFKLPGQNHGAHGEQTSPAPHWKEWSSDRPPPPPPSPPFTFWLQEEQKHRGPSDTAYPGYREWLPAEDEDTGCLCQPHQGFQQSMEGGSSLQALNEDSLWPHVLMDLELLVPQISRSQAWWTDQLFSENQRSPTRWSHLTHSHHYFHWWHRDQLSSHIPWALHADDLTLWTKAEQVTTVATTWAPILSHWFDLKVHCGESSPIFHSWCIHLITKQLNQA